MELDELKGRWSSLEDQLKKQEIINEKLIQEIRQHRTGPVNSLLRYSLFSIAIIALIVLFLLYTGPYIPPISTLGKITYISLTSFSMIYLAICIYNFLHLRKIDFTGNISSNLQLVHRYRVNVKKQLVFIYSACVINLGLAIAMALRLPEWATWKWITLGIFIPLAFYIGYLEYKKIIKAKTDEVIQSLEKLKELEE